MAAICDVNSCGVLAIGRCTRCQAAFCQSHEGSVDLSRMDGFSWYPPLCANCIGPYMADEIAASHQKREAERQERRRVGDLTKEVQPKARKLCLRLLDELGPVGCPGARELVVRRSGRFSFGSDRVWAYWCYDTPQERVVRADFDRTPLSHFLTLDGQPILADLSDEPEFDWHRAAATLYREAVQYGIRLSVPKKVMNHPDWPEAFRPGGKFAPPHRK